MVTEESVSPWLDSVRLAAWLSEKLPVASPVTVTNVDRISGGLSAETYRVTYEADRDRDIIILRRDPPGGLVERDIELEYRVMECLADAPFPVPAMLGIELDPVWLERPFFIDSLADGTADRNFFNSASCSDIRPVLGEQFIEYMAAMHSLDIKATGLDFLTAPSVSEAAQHEIGKWKSLFERRSRQSDPLITEAFHWLYSNFPVAPRISLVHGEYRPGNFLFDGPKITGILDWEYAHLGDPQEDLGWACMAAYRLNNLESGFYDRDEFLDRYRSHALFSVDAEAVKFWEVFSNLKVMAIMETGISAFADKTMNNAVFNYGPSMNCAAEICRLIEL